ncbi:DEAD/DEAH box helicase [Methylorubrum populi]|uniref:DEAD/DEAH box helicase n=1 Tax=Methylorubrum populi TaxID=223967 RepID=UPI003F659B1E
MLDLFAHEVTARLPAEYHWRGRVAGNLVSQLAVPSTDRSIRFIERRVRERRIYVGDPGDGEKIALLPRSLQKPKDCARAVVVGGIAAYGDIEGALKGDGARWHGSRPQAPGKVTAAVCADIHRDIRATWNDALRLLPEKYDEDGLVSPGFRPPQIGAIHAVKAHWIVSNEPATLVMPTGSGKTETMLAVLISEPIERLLVVVPTDALRTQVAGKFADFGVLKRTGCLSEDAAYPMVAVMKKAPASVAEAEELFLRAQVVVTTMASMTRMGTEIQARVAELVTHLFVDEAHHIGADTWKALKGRFTQKKRSILQFTATPYRNDNRRVDGKFIFAYPLRRAQEDRLFTKVNYEPVFETKQDRADLAIVKQLGKTLERDEENGFLHLAMARTDTIARAEALLDLYGKHLPDYPAALVHSKMRPKERAAIIDELRDKKIRIIVCVDMLGEGFDLPLLKIAGLHDRQASETITLQFIGRFTRSQKGLGEATVIAAVSLKDPREWLNSLYREDADWNHLLQLRSAFKTERQRRREAFYVGLDNRFDHIPEEAIAPRLSTFVFRTKCDRWQPHALTKLERGRVLVVEDPVVQPELSLVMMVTRHEDKLRWARVFNPANVVYNLVMAHWDDDKGLLYVHSSTVDGIQLQIAKILAGDDVVPLGGEDIFRVLHGFRRIMLTNLGVKETDAKPVRFQLSAGIDITEQLERMTDNRTRVKTNLFGTGFVDEPMFLDEDDDLLEPAKRSIGCSTKGKVWSQDATVHPGEWVEWCRQVGPKIADENITTEMVLRNVLRPKRQQVRPEGKIPISVEWPESVLQGDEERVELLFDGDAVPLADCDIELTAHEPTGPIAFRIATEGHEARFTADIREGAAVYGHVGKPVRVRRGEKERSVTDLFREDPLTIRFTDGAALMGADLTESPGDDVPYFDLALMKGLDWGTVNLKKESQGPERDPESIQYAVIERLKASPVEYDLIFDGDGSGEVADVVAIRRQGRTLDVELYHCKYSMKPAAGARVDDLYPVCGQAMKSVRWADPRSRFLHQMRRQEENRRAGGGDSRFEVGNRTLVDDWLTNRRDFATRFKVVVVQPGYRRSKADPSHLPILGAVSGYLMSTYRIGFEFWANE